MGRYIEWDDVINRYPELNTLGGADEIGPTYINYAETFVDGLLSDFYTLPFSSNNETIKDLSIDFCYARAARFKFEDAASVYTESMNVVNMIKAGKLNLITNSGDVAGSKKVVGIYSSTQSYHSAFGIDDPLYWEIDADKIDDDQDSRL